MKAKPRPTTRKDRKAKSPAKVPKTFTPLFWDDIDKRQAVAKRIQNRYDELVIDAGIDSVQQNMLARRAVFLELQIQTQELNAIQGEPVDFGSLTQMVNCLSGLLTKLGIPKSESYTVDLSEYVNKTKSKKKNKNK